MTCTLTEDELLSGLDRASPEIHAHLAACPVCRSRADEIQGVVTAFSVAVRPPEAPMPERVGSYRIHKRLGVGGMGVVYEAEQQSPRRLVALKVVRGWQHVDEYRLRLLEREAETLARLRHPNIAAIYEGGRGDDGQPFFAMELVRGVPLTDYVEGGALPRRARLAVFIQVCSAISYAHQRGVIHRDIKPSNILVDAEGSPKILDFGLARIADPEGGIRTETLQLGRIMGTLPYMSPEEARGIPDEIDTRSDVYSLGMVFYQLLTGELPYTIRGRGIPESIRIICEEAPRRPHSIDRSLRGDLETIALKALEKSPARRYQSVAAFSDDIQRYLRHEPILARPATPLYHFSKFLIRHRLFCFFLLMLVALFVAVSMWTNRTAEYLRAGTLRNIEMENLRAAITEERLARALAESSRFDEAEGPYRSAREAYRRLGEAVREAGILIGYAALFVDRPAREAGAKDDDYQQAEAILWEAVDLLEPIGPAGRENLIQAFTKLRELYGPDRWNAPDARATVEAELLRLTAPPRLPGVS